MPYGSASSVKCERLRGSLSTVSWLEMPASSVRKYRTPPAMLIFESASAGAAVARSAPATPAAISSDLVIEHRNAVDGANFRFAGVCEAGAMSPRAWAAFAAMSVIWGVPYLFIRVAVDDGVPPSAVAWVRVVLAGAVL